MCNPFDRVKYPNPGNHNPPDDFNGGWSEQVGIYNTTTTLLFSQRNKQTNNQNYNKLYYHRSSALRAGRLSAALDLSCWLFPHLLIVPFHVLLRKLSIIPFLLTTTRKFPPTLPDEPGKHLKCDFPMALLMWLLELITFPFDTKYALTVGFDLFL